MQWQTVGQVIVLLAGVCVLGWILLGRKNGGSQPGVPVSIKFEPQDVGKGDPIAIEVYGAPGDVVHVSGSVQRTQVLAGPNLVFSLTVDEWPWSCEVVVTRKGKTMGHKTIRPSYVTTAPVAHDLWANGLRTGFMEHDKAVIDCRYLWHGCNSATGQPTSMTGIEDPDFTAGGAIYSVENGFDGYHVEVRDLNSVVNDSVFVDVDRHLLRPDEFRKDPLFVWFAGEKNPRPTFPYEIPNIGFVGPKSARGTGCGGGGCTPLPVEQGPEPQPVGTPNKRIVIRVLKDGEVYAFFYDVYVQKRAC